ncbi:Endophilin-B1 [Portunus trituberculatus]|uniref:Endophilin-B1 n=1 Tax=Portunus trituberculatus TaxID=210409 RepID=A0A5B7D4G9_PORTR|nr:Endophilin-B1 [Portunus trituberculatus]
MGLRYYHDMCVCFKTGSGGGVCWTAAAWHTGSALLKVGGAEQRLGLLEREFVSNAIQGYLQPMRKFLDTEMKTITRERRLLETKRLDLDACKSRLRKARSMDGQSSAEAELRKAQADFDRQTEITKLLLEGVRSSQAAHLRHLNELVEAQAQYYEQCQKVMTDLQKEMARCVASEIDEICQKFFAGEAAETSRMPTL